MLEQGLSFILKGLLNDFIEDGDRLHEKVQVGLWSGYIVLEDLRIKSSVLSLIDVPLSLQYGYIGSLEIRIPFARLGIEPVTVVLNKLVILLEPKYEWNEEIAAGKEQAIKQAKLAAAELFATNRLEQSKKSGIGGNWFVNALLSKIIDNIQITVRDVHIRYEDTVSCPTDFCFGVSFESLHLQSRDAQSKYEESITPMKANQYPDMSRNFEKELSIGGADAFYKLAELNHMAVYWNPLYNQSLDACSCRFAGRSDKEVLQLMTKTIAARGNSIVDRPHHKYILQPMDINAFFDCSMGGQKAHLRVVLADMAIVLEDRQMREIISFALNMTNFMKLGKYSHLRPKVSIAEDKLAWFRYAGNVVLQQVQAKRKRSFTRARFNQRMEDKMVYIELWRSRLLTSPSALQKLPGLDSNLTGFGRSSLLYLQLLNTARRRRAMASTDSELATLNHNTLNEDSIRVLHFLERELEFQDLLYFRSLAEKMFSSEERKATWMGSLLNWASGGKPSNSEEDRRKLYEALRFEPESLYKGGYKDVDTNEVNFIANIVLKEGSVTLALSPPDASNSFQKAVPFFKLKLTELKQKAVMMGGGAHVKVFVSLQDFEAFELLPNLTKRKKAPDTIAHHIIHRRNLRADSFDYKGTGDDTESNVSFADDKSVSSASKSKLGGDLPPPLFSSTIEIFPPGNDIEVAVDLEVEEMEVWISPGAKWIDSIVAFSSWPEEQQYWSEMEMHAMNQLADIKSRVDAKVAYMMENHSSIKIEGKIQAPVLVIHDSRYNFGSGKADVLIVDLGTIYLQTEKLAKVERQKDVDAKSEFKTNQSISVLHARSPDRLDLANAGNASSSGMGMVMGPDGTLTLPSGTQETDKNWQMLENDDLAEFQDAKMQDLDSISKQLPFAENTFGFDAATDRPHRRSSGLNLPTWKPSTGEEKDDDSLHELFDIFQARVTKIEVYFIEVSQEDIREYGHGLWNNSTELHKTVLVPGFEIYSEIQVSVLPWDPTIPPFKVYSSISEINVQLSDAKIMRLLNFGKEIAKGTVNLKKKPKPLTTTTSEGASSSAAAGGNNNSAHDAGPMSKRGIGIPFRFLQNARRSVGIDLLNDGPRTAVKRAGAAGSSNASVVSATPSATHGAMSRTAVKSHRTNRRRRSRSYGGGSTAGHSLISDFRENKSQRSLGLRSEQASVADSSRMSRSRSRHRPALAELEYQASHAESHAADEDFDSDDDDATFFSFDNNYDPEDKDVLLEDFKYQMTQRETMRAKLIQDIRLAENDAHKATLCEQLKAELMECEMHLHQLKISYVELLVANDEHHDDVMIREFDKEEMHDKFDTMFTPAKPDEGDDGNGGAPTTTKRDFTHARENMMPQENQMEEIHYNKELVFLQMTLGVVNVDFEIPKHPHNPFLRTYRFSIGGLGTKLRHKVFDTKVSMYLREMVLSELLVAPGAANSMSSVPLITSDPSIFSSYAVPMTIRPNAMNSSPDLLRIRYSISYGNKTNNAHETTETSNSDIHQAQVSVGYLGLNLRWQKLTPLMEEFMRIAYKMETKDKDAAAAASASSATMSSSLSISSDVSSQPNKSLGASQISPNLRRGSHTMTSRILEGDEASSSTSNAMLAGSTSGNQGASVHVSLIPKVQVSVKVSCISVTLMNDTQPLLNATMTSLAIKADTLHRKHLGVKLVDLAVYDLHSKMETRTERYSRSAMYSIDSSNVLIGKNIYDNGLFFQVSSENFDVTKAAVTMDIAVKMAGIVAVTDGSLMIAMCQTMMQVDKEVQSILRMYPLKALAKDADSSASVMAASSINVDASSTTPAVTLPTLQIHAKVNSEGIKVHLPVVAADGRLRTVTFDVGGVDVDVQVSKLPGSTATLPTVAANVSIANIGASVQFKPLLLPFTVQVHVAHRQYESPVHTPMHDFAYRHFEDNESIVRPCIDVDTDISRISLEISPETVVHLMDWQQGLMKLMTSIESTLQVKKRERPPALSLSSAIPDAIALPDITLKAHLKVHSVDVAVLVPQVEGPPFDCALRHVIEDIQVVVSLDEKVVHADVTVHGIVVEAAKASVSPYAKLLVSNSIVEPHDEVLQLGANHWIRIQTSMNASSCDAIVDIGGLYTVITPAELMHLVDVVKIYAESCRMKAVGNALGGGNSTTGSLPSAADMPSGGNGRNGASAGRGLYAHPSSVPMRVSETTRGSSGFSNLNGTGVNGNHGDTKDAKKAADLHVLTIVDWQGLFRAIPLAINVDMNLHGIQVYIPVDPEDKHHTPEILKIGVAASLQCSLPQYADFNTDTDLPEVSAVSLFRVDKHDVSLDVILLKEAPHEYSPSSMRSMSPMGDGVNVGDISDDHVVVDGELMLGSLSRSTSGNFNLPSRGSSHVAAWERLLQQVMDSQPQVSTTHTLVDVTVHGRTVVTASAVVASSTATAAAAATSSSTADGIATYHDHSTVLEPEPDRRSIRMISDVEVTKCEVKFFADYRPFLLLNEQLVDPLVKRLSQIDFQAMAAASASATPSGSSSSAASGPASAPPSTVKGDSVFHSPLASSSIATSAMAAGSASTAHHLEDELVIHTIASVPALLGRLVDVGTITVNVHIPSVAVSIWNDINIHPIFFGQVMISDVRIGGTFQPLADVYSARLLNTTCPPLDHPMLTSRLFQSTLSTSTHRHFGDDKLVRDLFGAAPTSTALAPRVRGKRHFLDDFVQTLQVKVDGTLSITYQNQRLLAIEPLIEPTALSIKFTQLFREDQTMALILFLNNYFQDAPALTSSSLGATEPLVMTYQEESHRPGVLQRFAVDHFLYPTAVSSPIPPNLEVMIDKMNFNITTPLIQSIFTLVKSLTTVDKGVGRRTAGSKADKWESSMVLIRNEVGLPMHYWGTHDDSHRWMLPTGEEVGWSASLVSTETRDGGPRHLNIAIAKPDGSFWPEIRDISFDGTGCRVVTLGQGSNGVSASSASSSTAAHRRAKAASLAATKGPVVILELSAKEGRKILVVRSSIRVFNATKSNMSVQFVESVPHHPSIAWELTLPPSKGAFVPINVCNVYVNGIVVSTNRAPSRHSGGFASGAPSLTLTGCAGFIPCPEAVGMDSRDRVHLRTDGFSGSETSGGGGSAVTSMASSASAGSAASLNTSLTTVDTSSSLLDVTQNRRRRRKKLIQQKGVLNMTTYFHWINMQDATEAAPALSNPEDIDVGVRKMHRAAFVNAMVEARDAPSKKVAPATTSNELSLLRTIKLIAPVTVVNLLGKNIVVALYPCCSSLLERPSVSPEESAKVAATCLELVPHLALQPGEAGECLALHATEAFYLALRFADDDLSSTSSSSSSSMEGHVGVGWSTSVLVPGCLDHAHAPATRADTLSTELTFRNGSKLTILVEIVDKGGCRTVNVYTPFWLLPASFLPLQFQHDVKYQGNPATPEPSALNGIDQLLADQAYTEVNKKTTKFFAPPLTAKQQEFIKSVSRAKGMNGVILGPEMPLRGLANALRPLPKNDRTVRRIALAARAKAIRQGQAVQDDWHMGSPASTPPPKRLLGGHGGGVSTISVGPSTPGGNGGALTRRPSAQLTAPTFPRPSSTSYTSTQHPSQQQPQPIIHCSYTNKDQKSCRLKIRNRNTLWSRTVFLDGKDMQTLRLACADEKPIDDFDGDDMLNSPFVRDGQKALELGIRVEPMEAPFQRTKAIYVVDRYAAVNLVGQTLEIKQGHHDTMLTLRPQEEATMWFRPDDPYVFQVRLARYGWSWSGKFTITTKGDIPVRLRNDYDNTVFFLVVTVHHSGPLVKILFKNGDKYSPFRFENHSMETFKIKQRGQALYTSLLPYHCCAYAWDEPLAPHQFVVCIQRPGQQMQDDWDEVGCFSFDRIEALMHTGPAYLAMQIVTQGPTRVLQIRDTRIATASAAAAAAAAAGAASAASPIWATPTATRNPAVSGSMMATLREQSLLAEARRKSSFDAPGATAASSATTSKSTSSSTATSAAFTLFRLSLSIHLIGLSIIDHVPQELLYISFTDIAVEQLVAKSQHTVNMSVARFQIDNQLINTPYPSLLHPLKEAPSASYYYTAAFPGRANATGGGNLRKNSSIVMTLQQSFDYDGVAFFPYFSIDIAPFDVNVEMNLVAALINLASYTENEFQETTVISRQQVVAMGAAIAHQPYAVSSTSATTMLPPVQSGGPPSLAPLSTVSGAATTTGAAAAAASSASTTAGPTDAYGGHSNGYGHSTKLSIYDLYDALSAAPIAMGLAQHKLSRTQIFSIYYQLSKQQHAAEQHGLDAFVAPHAATNAAHAASSAPAAAAAGAGSGVRGTATSSSSSSLWTQQNLATSLIAAKAAEIHTIDGAIRPSAKIYFQHFEIGAFRINISLHPVMSTEITSFGDEWFAPLLPVIVAVASTFANIDNCPLRFSRVTLDHVFASSAGFAETLGMKYGMEAAKQWYLLLFSSQWLGNPVQLIQTLGEGLWDFINLPAMGLATSPEAFAMGILQGSLSLARNVVASLCTTTGHLVQSLQAGLITWGAVDAYPRPLSPTAGSLALTVGGGGAATATGFSREASHNHLAAAGAASASQTMSRSSSTDNLLFLTHTTSTSSTAAAATAAGTATGGGGSSAAAATSTSSSSSSSAVTLVRHRPNGLVDAWKMGLVGVVLDPFYGFQQDGLTGLMVGLTKGTVGFFTRPLYGTLGVTASILEALSYRLLPRYLAHQKMRLSRVRPPRFFAHANVPLQVYSAEENAGQELLARIGHGQYRSEGYLWHGLVQEVSSSTRNAAATGGGVSATSTTTAMTVAGGHTGHSQILLLTKQRLLLLEDFWQYTGVLWQCSVRDVTSLMIDASESTVVSGVETAIQLVDPSSSSTHHATTTTTTTSIRHCRLRGQPLLSVCHTPQQKDKSPREMAAAATPQASPGGTLSAGMRKAQEKLRFPDHESLLTLLERLLSVKEALASPDIVQYYKDSTGDVDLTALASLHGHRFGGGGGGGGGGGRRSPVPSMFASSRVGGAGGRGDGGDVQDTSVDGGASDVSDPAPLLFSPKPRSGAVVGGMTLGGSGGGLSLSTSATAAAAAAHVASLRSPSPVLPMSSAGMSLEGHGHQPLHHHNVHHAVHLLHHGNRSTILAPRTPTSRPASNVSLASTHSQSSSSTSNAGLRRLTTPPLPAPLSVPSLHPAATARPLPAKVPDVATGSLFSPTPSGSVVLDAVDELPPVPTQSTANSRTSSGSDNFDDDLHHSEQ